MSSGYREHPDATDELLDAIRRHHTARAGLGDRLAARVRAAISDIVDSPESWPPIPGWSDQPVLRGRRVAEFPYRVVNYLRGDDVIVIAYAHARRRPEYWHHRATDSTDRLT